jgi:hypothetical protein
VPEDVEPVSLPVPMVPLALLPLPMLDEPLPVVPLVPEVPLPLVPEAPMLVLPPVPELPVVDEPVPLLFIVPLLEPLLPVPIVEPDEPVLPPEAPVLELPPEEPLEPEPLCAIAAPLRVKAAAVARIERTWVDFMGGFLPVVGRWMPVRSGQRTGWSPDAWARVRQARLAS